MRPGTIIDVYSTQEIPKAAGIAEELAGVVDLFAAERGPEVPARTPIAVAASTVLADTIIVLGVAASQTNRATGMFHAVDASSASSSVISAEASRAAGAPIEPVSLTHEQSDARVTIRGVVRNPAGVLELPHLTAVVLLSNRIGVFAGTWRAAVDAAGLEPGAEAHFTVSVPHVSDIGRYRVSFSMEDHVVPHVDKRDGA